MKTQLKPDAPIRYAGKTPKKWSREELVCLIDDVITERFKRLRDRYQEKQENQ